MNIVDHNSWNNILDKMIIIGGSARSGTTIMGKLIHSLKNVEYQFEPPLLTSLLLKKDELSNESFKELLQFYFFDNFLLDCLAGRNLNFNRNDDSCIFHVKSEEEVNNRQQKSLSRVELERLVKNSIFSFKLPEVLFFLDTMDLLFKENKKVLMHRNPNDVINSIVKKKWFSDELLQVNHPSQVFATEIMNGVKVPYWVENIDKEFWTETTEVNRSAYYYLKISEAIVKNINKAIIIDYDKFLQHPKLVFSNLLEKTSLQYGEKTKTILDTVKYQNSVKYSLLEKVDPIILSPIFELHNKIKLSSL